jgi:Spy/CpxP family protein refolding chaperone
MHRNPRRTLVVLLLMGLVALPALTAAARGRHGGSYGLRGLERGVERLELTDEVRAQVDAIFEQARPDERELRGRMRDAHEQMRALLEQDAPDEQAVFAQADALGQLHAEAHKLKLRTLLQIRPLLTEEQRAELRTHKRKQGPQDRRGERSLR